MGASAVWVAHEECVDAIAEGLAKSAAELRESAG
jgi:hypothetical protein